MGDLDVLPTELRNPRSSDLDQMTPLELVTLMNEEDASVAAAVHSVLPEIARAIELATSALAQGGRIIYVGAGTSGRLGLLDAAECPPTFGVSPDVVCGLIAGGERAIMNAVEGAEDSTTQGAEDLRRIGLSKRDLCVGLSASGRTPYVLHGLAYARSLGCATVAIACVRASDIGREAEVAIEPETSAEVLSGSTRLKAGTAQKMVLNMISTGAMVGMGKAYKNLMVDLRPTNEKLKVRSLNIVREATGCTASEARRALDEAGGDVKAAIVMLLVGETYEQARETLDEVGGRVRSAVERAGEESHGCN